MEPLPKLYNWTCWREGSESLGGVYTGVGGAAEDKQGVDQLVRDDGEWHGFGKTQGRHIHDRGIFLSCDSSSNVWAAAVGGSSGLERYTSKCFLFLLTYVAIAIHPLDPQSHFLQFTL